MHPSKSAITCLKAIPHCCLRRRQVLLDGVLPAEVGVVDVEQLVPATPPVLGRETWDLDTKG